MENPGLSTKYQRETQKAYAEVKKTDEYAKAKSCIHCTDTADSFNNYVSTYCHIDQTHMYGFGENTLSKCQTCKNYKRRQS